MSTPQELVKKLDWLKNQLIQRATGGTMDDNEYSTIRQELVGEELLRDKLPDFLHRCRNSQEFWGYIKTKFAHYQERRDYLRDEFNPALTFLEEEARRPHGGVCQSFSRRHGLVDDEPEISIREDAPEDFRYFLLSAAQGSLGLSPRIVREIVCDVLRRRPDASNWSEYPNIWGEVEELSYGCEWYRVYDIVEAIFAYLVRNDGTRAALWESSFNDLCREKGIGWKLEDGLVQSRGDDAFEIAASQASKCLGASSLVTAKSELAEAFRDLSRRPSPDLSGAVHHALASLECVARDIVGDQKATLGEIIKRNPGIVPRPLDDAVAKVWGYSSENARHGRENRKLDLEEAQLIVGLAAVLAGYLVQKPWPSGAGL
jgi:hypothetical protein